MLAPPKPSELVLILDLEEVTMELFQELVEMEVIDAVQTPFEYAVSMVPHQGWMDLVQRITYDMLTMHPAFYNHTPEAHERVLTYEMLIELTNHPDIKSAIYAYDGSPLGTLYYQPPFTYDVEPVKQALDELVCNGLEELLLETLANDGVDTQQPGFRLYNTQASQSSKDHADLAIWRFLMGVFSLLVRSVRGVGWEHGLTHYALAQYRDFQPCVPIKGGQSEFLYAVTIREA